MNNLFRKIQFKIFIKAYFKRLGVRLAPTRANYLKVLHTRLDQMK